MVTAGYTFDDVSRLLAMPETVLARLCHVFKLPAAAFTSSSRVLVRGDAPFTQADLDRLSAIHQAVLAGEPLKTIQQRFARQDAVAQRAALPLQPNFLSVLSQQAKQPLSTTESSSLRAQMHAKSNPQPTANNPSPTPLPTPPAEAVLAQLASRIQKPPTPPKAPPPFVNIAKPVSNITDGADLKALFPQALQTKNSLLSDLQGVDPAAKPTTRPVWTPQTAPTTFKSLPTAKANSKTVLSEPALTIVPTNLQQAFRRRTQHTNATVQDSFKAF